jgi:hypothetical protein
VIVAAVGSLIVWALIHRNDHDGYHWTDTDF